MSRVPIETLKEDELLELKARVDQQLERLQRGRTANALASRYRAGMQVMVDAWGLGVVSASVVRANQKTVTVRTETGQVWRVPPSDLMATEEDAKNLVEEAMPFLALSQEDYEAWIRENVPALADGI